MKKVYRFTYWEAIEALQKLHSDLIPDNPSPYIKDHEDDPIFEIEPRVIEEPKERQVVHLDGPITVYSEPRTTHHDDGYPI